MVLAELRSQLARLEKSTIDFVSNLCSLLNQQSRRTALTDRQPALTALLAGCTLVGMSAFHS